MSKVWHVGDLHWGQENPYPFRGEEIPENHDSVILYNILSTVSKRDTLWIHGDICFTWDSVSLFEALYNYIDNVKIILGNHDTDRGHRRDIIRYMVCELGVQFHANTQYKRQMLSHYPVHPDSLKPGQLNIHGHTHYKNVDGPYFNVSLENINWKPIGHAEVIERAHYEHRI